MDPAHRRAAQPRRPARGAAAGRRHDGALSARRLLQLPTAGARDLRDAGLPQMKEENMNMLRNTLFAVAAVALGGCNNAAPPPADVRGCWGTGCAIVTTSHYNPDYSGVGTINAVQMSQSKIVRGLDSSLDPDVAVDIAGDKLYVLN